jgi:hypothetical protein
LIDDYYALAPIIMPKVENNPEQLEKIFNTITECVKDIKEGQNDRALNTYLNMVKGLEVL